MMALLAGLAVGASDDAALIARLSGPAVAIEMALQLAGRLASKEYAYRIQAVLENDPPPPLGPMDCELASAEGHWSRTGTPGRQKASVAGLLEDRPDVQARLA